MLYHNKTGELGMVGETTRQLAYAVRKQVLPTRREGHFFSSLETSESRGHPDGELLECRSCLFRYRPQGADDFASPLLRPRNSVGEPPNFGWADRFRALRKR